MCYAYRYDHAVVLLDSTATSEERDEEYNDTNNDHKNGYGEKPIVNKVSVPLIQPENNPPNRDENDSSNLKVKRVSED